MAQKLGRAKQKAWEAFSLYVRTRDSIKTTGSTDSCICITCGKLFPRTGVGCIQAGHFISGRGNAILFDERAVNGQCYACNVGRGGAYVEYFVWMEDNYGRDVIDELRILKNQPVKFKVWELNELERKYKELTEELLLTA